MNWKQERKRRNSIVQRRKAQKQLAKDIKEWSTLIISSWAHSVKQNLKIMREIGIESESDKS